MASIQPTESNGSSTPPLTPLPDSQAWAALREWNRRAIAGALSVPVEVLWGKDLWDAIRDGLDRADRAIDDVCEKCNIDRTEIEKEAQKADADAGEDGE